MMYYSEKEICRSFLNSVSPVKQVKILAELNNCTTRTIFDILKKADLISEQMEKKLVKKYRLNSTPQQSNKAPQRQTMTMLYGEYIISAAADGLSNAEISANLGMKRKSINELMFEMRKKGFYRKERGNQND